MGLVGELVRNGLFEIGDLTGESARFVPWETTLDQSLSLVQDCYIDHFDDVDRWSWFCWLDLTVTGAGVAKPIEDRLNSAAPADEVTPSAPPEASPSADRR